MAIPARRKIEGDLIALLDERGPTTPAEAYSELARRWALSEKDKADLRGGRVRYQHDIRWARQALVIQGIVDRTGPRALWQLKNILRDSTDLGDEILSDYEEGASVAVNLNRYERSIQARRKCLELRGYSCSVCGL